MCRFKFAFQTVCVLPTVCVRRAAFAAPFRQCAGSNSPFKLFAYCQQLVYGGRLSPHPSGIVPVQIRLSNRLCVFAPRLTASGFSRTILTFYLCFFYFVLAKRQRAAPNLPATYRFKFAFQTACAFLHLV